MTLRLWQICVACSDSLPIKRPHVTPEIADDETKAGTRDDEEDNSGVEDYVHQDNDLAETHKSN